MNIADIIVIVCIVVLFAVAFLIFRAKKSSGKGITGCCENCSSCCGCNKRDSKL